MHYRQASVAGPIIGSVGGALLLVGSFMPLASGEPSVFNEIIAALGSSGTFFAGAGALVALGLLLAAGISSGLSIRRRNVGSSPANRVFLLLRVALVLLGAKLYTAS
jgi:uncharacterized membrane protein